MRARPTGIDGDTLKEDERERGRERKRDRESERKSNRQTGTCL